MASLTIKKFPDTLLRNLKEEAREARRSLTQEVLIRLEHSLSKESRQQEFDRVEIERQATHWETLAGRWVSDLAVEEEIDQLYRARSAGRNVKL